LALLISFLTAATHGDEDRIQQRAHQEQYLGRDSLPPGSHIIGGSLFDRDAPQTCMVILGSMHF
jgi:hypothetical protein